jgi:hypothetical protein
LHIQQGNAPWYLTKLSTVKILHLAYHNILNAITIKRGIEGTLLRLDSFKSDLFHFFNLALHYKKLLNEHETIYTRRDQKIP